MTTKTTDIKLASTVSRDVELDAVLLRAANVRSSVLEEARPARLESKQHLGARYTLVRPERLHVTVEFKLELVAEQIGNLLVAEAEYLLVYRLPEGKTYESEALRYFAELNGMMNAWPFWRELVNSIVARVGLGSMTLPVFRVKAREIELGSAQTNASADPV